MAAAFVNATGKQRWDGANSTALVSDAWALTAANLAVVVLRHSTGSITPSNFSCTDTLGNAYGSPVFAADKVFWICNSCLGGSAVVTVTYPSSAFSAIVGLQFSDPPPGPLVVDVGIGQTVGGTTTTAFPASAHEKQIVVLMGDTNGNQLPTVTVAAPGTYTNVYTSGPAGNGPFVGVGGFRLGYDLNTTRLYDGTVGVTATDAGGLTMTAYGVIIRQPIDVVTQSADLITESTARLNGLVTPNDSSQDMTFRWDTVSPPIANNTGLVATVADTSTPTAFQTTISSLTNGQRYYFRAVATDVLSVETLGSIRSFVIGLPVDYEDPCDITEPRVFTKITTEDDILKYAIHPMRDSAARGGFAEPRLLDVGTVTKAASDPTTGAWSAQTATTRFADTDRVNREASANRTSFRNCNQEIYLTSQAQRLSGGPPRVLFSGTVYADAADPNLSWSTQINDLIGSNYSLFSEEKQIPQRRVSRVYFPNMPPQSVGKGEPIIGGRHAPNGADNSVPGPRHEGIIPTIPVGLITWGGTPGSPTGTTLADLVAALQADKDLDNGSLYNNWGGIFGFADIQSLQDYGSAVPSTYNDLAGGVGSFVGLGFQDVDAYLNRSAETGGNQYWAELVCGHAITEILNGGNGDPSVWIDDTQLDPGLLGTDWWSPQIPGDTTWAADITTDLFLDIVGSDATTRRYTLLLFDPASDYGTQLAGGARCHLDCIGIEDVGDGTGNTINDYFKLYRHLLTNFLLQTYLSGLWLESPQFLFSDGVTVLDRVNGDSFSTASAVAILQHAGGRLGSLYLGDQASIRDVIRDLNFSGGCLLGQDDFGRLFVKILDVRRTEFLTNRSILHRTLRDKVDFLPGFHVTPKPEWQANSVTYEYAMNDFAGTFEHAASGGGVEPVIYQAGIDRDGLIKKTIQLRFVRDDATALYVAAYYRDLFANLPHVVEYARRGLCGLEDDILDGVPVTHYNGFGVNGFQDRALWVLSRTTDARRMYCSFTALDVDLLLGS